MRTRHLQHGGQARIHTPVMDSQRVSCPSCGEGESKRTCSSSAGQISNTWASEDGKSCLTGSLLKGEKLKKSISALLISFPLLLYSCLAYFA